MKSELLKVTEVGEYGQFWLGAYTEDRHDEHQPGNWTWTHKNAPVEWFDWAEGQPNNIHGQNCLVMQEVHYFLFPLFRDYFWNDFSCDLYGQNCLVMQEVHDFLFPMFRYYFWNDFSCDLY